MVNETGYVEIEDKDSNRQLIKTTDFFIIQTVDLLLVKN